jgi:protein tyrosine phosphatase (PTP) superfamily phosphohydrolase (DUF442 family)
MSTIEDTSQQGYLSWAWNAAKLYARSSYPLSYAYGRVRGAVQPWISTSFNVQHIQDGVYIGDLASASNHTEMKKLGITHVISAVPGAAPAFPKDFKYMHVPVMDIESENIKPYLRNAIMFIDDAIFHKGKVLVHCMCGVSRSATIVAAWLISRQDSSKTVEDTLRIIREKRGCINPNPGFKTQLEEYRQSDKIISLLNLGSENETLEN